MGTDIIGTLESYTDYPIESFVVDGTTEYIIVITTPLGKFTKETTTSGMFTNHKAPIEELINWVNKKSIEGTSFLQKQWLKEYKLTK